MGRAEKRAYARAIKACTTRFDRSRLGRLLTTTPPSYTALLNEWANVLAQVDQTRSVRAAGAAAQGCAGRRGFAFRPDGVDYVGGFLGVVQGREAPLVHTDAARARAIDHRAALTMTACFGAYETLRDRMRKSRLEPFFARNALAIRDAVARYHAAEEDIDVKRTLTGAP